MCADELIAKGDACALKCEATEALKYYLPAEKLESANEHLLARISRNDARSFIKKGLAMRETEKDDPETKREGQEVLAKLR